MAIYKVTLFSIFDYLIFIVKILVTPTKTKKGVTNIVYLQTKTNELPLNLCKFSNGRLAKMSHNVFKILSIATMCMAEAGGVTTRTHAWRKQKKMFSLSTHIAYYFLGINLLECCLIEIRYFHIYCKKGMGCFVFCFWELKQN